MHATTIIEPKDASNDPSILEEGSPVAFQDKTGAACHKYIGCPPGKCGTNECRETIVRVQDIFEEFSKEWKSEK